MIYRFGLYELDTRTSELRRDGRRLPLQEQPLSILEALLERAGDVVERDTLRRRLWPEDHHVDVDGGINAAVRRLRETLDDSATRPLFVATVPRRGYRFVAPVERVGSDAPTPEEPVVEEPVAEEPTSARPWLAGPLRLAALLVATLLVGALAGRILDRFRPPAEPPDSIRLAVLPFSVHGADPERAFLGDALADELIVRLGRLEPERLRVVARASVQGFRGSGWDLDTVARRLDVDYVLEGSVQHEADRLRIHVALVETRDHAQTWSRTFDRRLGALLPLEREIAERVARSLALELAVDDARPVPTGRAHELYLEGRYFLGRLGASDLERALQAFEAAAVEDPGAASAAWAGAAEALVLAAVQDFIDPRDAFPEARRLAERALAQDPRSASAVLVLALVEHLHAWDLEAAAPLYARALDLNPGSPSAHLFAAGFESHLGHQERALEMAEQALSLDPLSPAVHSQVCRRLFVARCWTEAVDRCRRAIELDEDFLLGWDELKWIHIRRGHDAEAVDAFLRVVELEGEHKDALPRLRRVGSEGGIRALLELSLEDPGARLAESGQSPFNLALDLAALGRADEAVGRLLESYEARESDLPAVAVDPRLDALHGHPRFRELVSRLGLELPDLPLERSCPAISPE